MTRNSTSKPDSVPASWDPVEEAQAHARLQARLFGRDQTSKLLDRYVLAEKIGEGGNGVVYRGSDPQLDRSVAIKLVRMRGARASTTEPARLEREAKALARLSHPNIVEIYDTGRYSDGPRVGVYLVTELLPGLTLREWLETSRSWRDVLSVFMQAGSGLAAAHKVGLVHRDFKPSNVIVGPQGRVRVLDFGLARFDANEIDESLPSSSPEVVYPGDERLTRNGAVVGTPRYMAPEQTRGDSIDARADQYSFCLALYEAFEGKMPDAEQRARTTVCPRPIATALARGLATEPNERFPNMDALLEVLGRKRWRRWPILVAAGGALAAAAVGLATSPPTVQVAEAPLACGRSIDEVWRADSRVAVQAAIQSHDLRQDDLTAQAVTAALDAYASEWREAASLADNPEPSSAIATCSCLRRQLSRVEVLVATWSSSERAAAEVAVYQANEALPSPADCRVPRPPPSRDIPIQTLEELTHRADAAFAMSYRSETDAAFEAAKPLRAEVDAAGAQQLGGELTGLLADLERQRGNLSESRQLFEETYARAIEIDDNDQAAWAAVTLVQLIGALDGEPESAKPWIRHAQVAIERSGNAIYDALLWSSRAGMREQLGDYAGALAAAQRAVGILERELGPTHPRVGGALSEVGFAASGLGRHDTAHEAHARVLQILEAQFGPDHLDVAKALVNLGMVSIALGDETAATEQFQRALSIVKPRFGLTHETTAGAHQGLALALKTSDPERSLTLAVTGYTAYAKLFGAGHPYTGDAAYHLGRVAVGVDDALARSRLREALAIATADPTPDRPQSILVLWALSQLERESSPDEAKRLRDRGTGYCAEVPQPRAAKIEEACAGLGQDSLP